MEWLTGEAPLDKLIEFEKEDGSIHKGRLRYSGLEVAAGDKAPLLKELRDQYCTSDQTEIFQITRWRYVNGD